MLVITEAVIGILKIIQTKWFLRSNENTSAYFVHCMFTKFVFHILYV